jgi:hypothetical protein
MSLPTEHFVRGRIIMNKYTIIGCVSLFALMLAGFAPSAWRPSVDATPMSSIAPFALMVSAEPMPVSAAADTF